MKDGKYSIELLREGEGHDIEIVLAREDDLEVAQNSLRPYHRKISRPTPDALRSSACARKE